MLDIIFPPLAISLSVSQPYLLFVLFIHLAATSMLRAFGTIGWNSNAELSNDCIFGIRHTDVMKITGIHWYPALPIQWPHYYEECVTYTGHHLQSG
jgi:hypothetical protein